MGKFVIFQFLNGSFDQGFPIKVQIGEDGDRHSIESSGSLPPAPEIAQYYRRWQDIYFNLGFSLRLPLRLEAPAVQVTNYSIQDCDNAAKLLRHSLNCWLQSESFLPIRDKMLLSLNSDDEVRIFVQSQDCQLQQLPWHLCDLFEYFPKAEIALIPSVLEKPLLSPRKQKVKILAIFGSSQGLDLRPDEALLHNLPNAEPSFLVNPQRQQLNDHLWEQGWSILFFAGHSSSRNNGEGRFYINDTEYLTIDNLKYALKKARANGLKLAIFNSCDGLGLARVLANLHIPQIIVMREPVPDQVAQAFLKYFLQSFANNQSFYLAVRHARERLQGLEGEFPCATWLPIACQNLSEKPLKWNDLYNAPIRIRPLIASIGLLTILVIAALILNSITGAINSKNRISLGNKILVNSVTHSDKEAGVKAFSSGKFELAINRFQKSLQTNRNDPETLIYLNNAKVGNRKSLKIAVSVPIGSNLNVAQEILRGVAQAQNEINHRGGIKGTPLKVAIANDDNNPQIAKKLATEFVKDPTILAVVGHNASDVSIAAAEVYQGQLVMISPTSFAKSLSAVHPENTQGNSVVQNSINFVKKSMGFEQKNTKENYYIFRTVPSIDDVANTLSAYTLKTVHKTKIAMCSDSQAVDNESFRNQFTLALYASGGKFINDVECDFSAPDFNPSAIISQAIKAGADSLLLAPHVDKINKAIEIAQANKGQLILLGSPTLYTSQTLESGKADVNGMVLAVPWYPEAIPGNSFTKEATKLWGGSVNWRTATAYDATEVIVTGLEQSDRTREGLRNAISAPWFSINGATGKVQFLPSGDRVGQGFLVQVQPGTQPGTYQFVPLKP
ncbi:MAG TPA: ABC transporter substrate-binding protein [Cyanobacteria bacterium UBA11162]|nr:ABC transporter substrate-binding protein [Cyanobacteria bacterium UBA11162]